MNVIAIATKESVRLHANRDVQIPGRSAHAARVAFAAHAQARAGLSAGRDPDIDDFRFR